MIRIIPILIATIFFSSCKTIKVNDLKANKESCVKLPALEPRVDLNSLESVYTTGSVVSKGVGTANVSSSGKSAIGQSVSVSTGVKDKRVQDAITIFDREVKDCLTDPYGKSIGYIVCKFASGETKEKYGFSILSGMLFFVPNLFGMPMATYKTELDLDIEIYNNNEELIGRYSANSKDKAFAALYHGYSFKNASRITGIRAFKKALNDVKKDINNDKENLEKKL